MAELQTASSWVEGMVLVVDGTCGRLGKYELCECNCCPEHLFWRHEQDCWTCYECWPGAAAVEVEG